MLQWVRVGLVGREVAEQQDVLRASDVVGDRAKDVTRKVCEWWWYLHKSLGLARFALALR